MEYVNTLVVGGGVVGLAVAAKLAPSRDVLLVEAEPHLGEHTSSRNSEVIHAGLYYPTNSLKAALCVRGKALLYDFCKTHAIPHRQLGKILVAVTPDEESKLAAIVEQAKRNGVHDLQPLSQRQYSNLLPGITAASAVLSPSTGIIDSHQFMLALWGELERNQGSLVCQTQVIAVEVLEQGFEITLNSQGELVTLQCKNLINAAGHGAQPLAKQIKGLAPDTIPEQYFCKGVYFRYHGKHPFTHLIYPMPQLHGLGIHATLDLQGQLKFGPDTEFVDELNYHVDTTRKTDFVEAIKRYWPGMDADKLQPDYAGVRPKLSTNTAMDFVIQDKSTHGINGLINLYGIESPGLTASLAIAEYCQNKL